MPAFSKWIGPRAALLMSAQDPIVGGLRQWLLSGSYEIDEVSNQSVTTLQMRNGRDYLAYLSFDFQRFALSARESFLISRMERSDFNLLGWPLIKLYYAAFFSAHALMRGMGSGVIRIERDQARTINEYGKIIIGEEYSFSSGDYIFSTEQAPDNRWLAAFVPIDRNSGGVHEAFWKEFSRFLTSCSNEISTENADGALEAVNEITDLAKILRARGLNEGTWLSSIRNAINYQHALDVWYPISRRHAGFTAIDSAHADEISGVRLDYNPSKKSIEAFVAACQYICKVNYDVCERVSVLSTSSKGFGGKWRRLNASIAPRAVVADEAA